MISLMALAGTVTHYRHQNVRIKTALLIIPAAVVFSFVGAMAADMLNASILRNIVGGIIILVGFFMVIKGWRTGVSVVSALSELNKEMEHCEDCELSRQRNRVVPGEGSEVADLLFIGEAPGWHEDQQGVPSSGRRGTSSMSCSTPSGCGARMCI